jgi:hypothetical protein
VTRMVEQKQARLLINTYDNMDRLNTMILESDYTAADPLMPALRFRGTVARAANRDNGLIITGWQRNVSRLRKMDVSLPTIITMVVDGKERIESIELDTGFAGSKGLICSHSYLNRRLKTLLQGQSLDSSFIHRVKQENTHCAHLFEVLSGIYAYYSMLKMNGFRDLRPRGHAYEEEVIDSYAEDGTLYSLGTHVFMGREPLRYKTALFDLMRRIGFTKNGGLTITQGIRTDFSLNGLSCAQCLVNDFAGFSGFLLRCLDKVRRQVLAGRYVRMFNSNLYPGAYLGLLAQAVAVRLFNNNYNYIMHAVTALQRAGDRPLCVGALNNQEEADRWFPGFSFSELV